MITAVLIAIVVGNATAKTVVTNEVNGSDVVIENTIKTSVNGKVEEVYSTSSATLSVVSQTASYSGSVLEPTEPESEAWRKFVAWLLKYFLRY